jgi:hypothetical protein
LEKSAALLHSARERRRRVCPQNRTKKGENKKQRVLRLRGGMPNDLPQKNILQAG